MSPGASIDPARHEYHSRGRFLILRDPGTAFGLSSSRQATVEPERRTWASLTFAICGSGHAGARLDPDRLDGDYRVGNVRRLSSPWRGRSRRLLRASANWQAAGAERTNVANGCCRTGYRTDAVVRSRIPVCQARALL